MGESGGFTEDLYGLTHVLFRGLYSHSYIEGVNDYLFSRLVRTGRAAALFLQGM